MAELTVISLKLLGVLALVLLNGFFVAAEFAIVKIRDGQLHGLIKQGHRRATMARQLIKHLDASLSATQLGITLASLGLGWIGEPVFFALLEPVMEWLQVESAHVQHTLSFAIGFSAITFLHIVVGELAPKSLAIQKPLPTSLWISYPLWWFYRLSYPAIWALNGTSLWLLRQVGVEPASEAERAYSEEELRFLIAGSQSQRPSTLLGHDIVLNALDLHRRIVLEVMRPRSEIAALDTEAPLAACLELAEKTRFSRFPLCEHADLDETLGVVHFKDLFAMRARAITGRDLAAVMKPLVYVPETARLEKVLQTLLDRKLHLAIVVDEYGGTVGLITLENILEELVGQIQDEFDTEKPMLVQTSPDSWDVLGRLPVHHLAELVEEPLEAEGISTVSGWVTHQLGGFPRVGDRLLLQRFQLRVTELDARRVGRLQLTRLPPKSPDPAEPA